MTEVDAVADEIRRLHRQFERCFRDDDAFDLAAVGAALANDFGFVAPNGQRATKQGILDGLQQAVGSRPITIRIENVGIVWERDDVILATYEEWHDRTDAPSTARLSTVLLTSDGAAPGGFVWHHVHETWMVPPAG